MNTAITIKAYSSLANVDLNNALDISLNEFHKVVARFTRFSDSSELGILNKSNGKFIEVSEDLFRLVKFGYDFGLKTDGLFDITIIDLLEAYGYDKHYDFSKLNNPKLENDIKKLISQRPNFKEIEFDEQNLKIKLAKKQRVDMGGYAKGYAIGLAKDKLITIGINDFIINAGGDIYANGNEIGSNLNNGWEVSIFDPAKSLKTGKFETHTKIILHNEALACSGPWARKVKFFHHLINPKTGLPAGNTNDISFVTHIDPMHADVMATIKYLENNFL
jgi:thiamine biosynthesis lipoprotein